MEGVTFSEKCKCGLLDKWARDRDSRIVYEESSGTPVLTLSASSSVAINYCPSCGGREESQAEVGSHCTCGSLQKWVEDPDIPVEMDSKFNEYYLVTRDNENILFYYCPVCGGESPQSSRGEFFTRPLDSDVAELKSKLALVKTLDDVVTILGVPDKTLGPDPQDLRKKSIYGLRDIKQTIKYFYLNETFDLTVQETTDGQISMIIEGKPQDRIADGVDD